MDNAFKYEYIFEQIEEEFKETFAEFGFDEITPYRYSSNAQIRGQGVLI